MVNETEPPPTWQLGWAPSCHTSVVQEAEVQEEQVLRSLAAPEMPVALSRESLSRVA